jgi:hypothetical protein
MGRNVCARIRCDEVGARRKAVGVALYSLGVLTWVQGRALRQRLYETLFTIKNIYIR